MSTSGSPLRCLVLNAGGSYLEDKLGAEQWACQAATAENRPHLAFVQEVPSDEWLARWSDQGYRLILGHVRGWKVRSAILTLLDEQTCVQLTADDMPERRYHGEYVAVARLPGWAQGADLTILSVHASPSPTSEQYLRHHPDPERLRARSGGADARYAGQLFDADVVLDTVSRYAPCVLACGDVNEARGWDAVPGHEGQTWGEEFFGRPDIRGRLVGGAVHAAGLVDVPLASIFRQIVDLRLRHGA